MGEKKNKKKEKEKSLYRGKVMEFCQIIEHLHKLISASWCLLSARLTKDNLIKPTV